MYKEVNEKNGNVKQSLEVKKQKMYSGDNWSTSLAAKAFQERGKKAKDTIWSQIISGMM